MQWGQECTPAMCMQVHGKGSVCENGHSAGGGSQPWLRIQENCCKARVPGSQPARIHKAVAPQISCLIHGQRLPKLQGNMEAQGGREKRGGHCDRRDVKKALRTSLS